MFPDSGWTQDRSVFPLVTALTFLKHLMLTGKNARVGEDHALVVRKPLERGNDLYFSGYVHDVFVHRDGSDVFVKTKCWATQKKSTKYAQKLLLSEHGEGSNRSADVAFAQCEGCVAGSDGGLCSHVFAVLMVLEKFRLTDHHDSVPGPESVTSLPRSWGPRERDVTPHPIMSVRVEKSREERKGPPITCRLYDARGPAVRNITDDDVGRLRNSLPENCPMKALLPKSTASVPTAYGHVFRGSLLSYHLSSPDSCLPDKPVVVPDLPPLPLPSARPGSVVGFTSPIPLQESQAIEVRTVGQASNAEWKRMHSYTITASNFHRVGSFAGEEPKTILRNLFDPVSLDFVPAIIHGKKYEKQAVSDYMTLKASEQHPVKTRPCGIALHTEYRYLGASPDGVVCDDSASPKLGLLEVKCPHTAFINGLTPEEAANTLSNFCLKNVGGQLRLRRSHMYYTQVQGQLHICNASWCDFVVWVGSVEKLFVERISADPQFWETILPKLQAFYTTHAQAYLQSRNRPVSTHTQPPTASSLTSAQASATSSLTSAQASAASSLTSTQPPTALSLTPATSDWSIYECLLPRALSQSRIDGRNGSNACTIISCIFVRSCLSSAASGDLNISQGILCASMTEGNLMYDSLHTDSLLSMDEALLIPRIGVQDVSESFVHASAAALDALIDFLFDKAQASPVHIAAGVFVLTPYSFSLVCHKDSFILFDSHSHGTAGALLARVPVVYGRAYLQHFFLTYYPALDFNEKNASVAAHVTFLGIMLDAL